MMMKLNGLLTLKSLPILVLFCGLHAPLWAQTKIMPLGNSITKGVSGPSTDDAGYRNDLDALLTSEGVAFDFVGSLSDGTGFDADHEGHDGFRADQILSNINGYLTSANPDIVILHIGTNDVSNNETPESTRDEIGQILDAITAFNSNTKIILSSIIPRTDGKDDSTDILNTLLEDLFYQKRDTEGQNLFYAGANEIFKQNSSWATDYFSAGDNVHPTDTGYNVMGQLFFDVVMTAINAATASVTDNFERSGLGISWDADPEIVIQGGDLVNTAPADVGNWKHMATYRAVRNPSSVSVKWAADADTLGIDQGGLALLLDSPNQNASGFAAWISPSDNALRLWTVTNGITDTDLLASNPTSLTSAPGPGSTFRVDPQVNSMDLRFDYFVNDQFAGTVTVSNPGVAGEFYSGIILRYDLNNDVDEFTVSKSGDQIAPASISDLSAGNPQATSILLTWTAPGDDGLVGIATSYDVRYATDPIDDTNFATATQASNTPTPTISGTMQSLTVSGLQTGTQHYFAMKVMDEVGNESGLSNVVTASTVSANVFLDNFNRATGLGPDWITDTYAIVNNRLSNTATDGAWDDIAVLTARKNPIEIAMEWGANTDAGGIDQAGFVVVFDSASTTSNGYAITRRTAANEVRLWRVQAGEVFSVIEKNTSPALSPPVPGDRVKVVISSDATSNKFDFYINDQFDGRVEDTAFQFDLTADKWAGVALRSNLNNDIDNFSVLLELGQPAVLSKVSGDAQIDTVAQLLDMPVVVQVMDDNGSPMPNINVNFEITAGNGALDVTGPSGDIVVEAESGLLSSPMTTGSDVNASNGTFIHAPEGVGESVLGLAQYLVHIDTPGDYTIWGRAIYPDANSDAFRVIVGTDTSLWDVGQRTPQTDWHWDEVTARGTGTAKNPEFDPVVFTFAAGSQTIKIQHAKDGAKLDQFVITPVGSGFAPPANQDPVLPSGRFTDSNGEAQVHWTLGTTAGNNSIQVNAAGLPPLSCTATGVADSVETIVKVSGDAQAGTPGQPLAEAFVAELQDKFGNVVPNIASTFSLLPPANGSLSVENTLSDGTGQLSSLLTMSTNVAVNQVKVAAAGYTGPDVVFVASAQAGPPSVVQIFAGDNQTASAGQTLASPLQAIVSDANGLPVSGFDVLFTVLSGGGNFAGQDSMTVTTDATGIAAATPALGPAAGASNQFLAFAAGLTNSPLTFNAAAAEPQELQAVSAPNLNGTSSLPLSDSVAVKILDALGAVVNNHPVLFSVAGGGGLVNDRASVTVMTGSSGIAQVEWRLGPAAGQNNLSVTSTYSGTALTGSPLAFTASAVAGPAESMAIVSGNDQAGLVAQPLAQPFVVEVMNNSGSPVSDWPVYFSVTAGGGTLSIDTTFTNSSGQAQTILTLGAEAGIENNRVTATSPQTASVDFLASANLTTASTMTLTGGGNQAPSPAGLVLPDSIEVRITDDSGSNVEGLAVTFEIVAGGGTIDGIAAGDTPKQVVSDANGLAAVSWYLGGLLGTNNQILRISAQNGAAELNGSPMNVAATALPGMPDADASSLASDKGTIDGNGQDQATITVTIRDKFGNAVPAASVTLTSSDSTDTIEQPGQQTNAAGQTTGLISSVTPGIKEISAIANGTIQLSQRVSLIVTDANSVDLALFTAEFHGFAGVSLQWSTAREVGNTGFNVLRSLSDKGDLTKINAELIQPRKDGHYSFVDKNVQAGLRYYYTLEDIDANGNRTQHGPISLTVTAPKSFVLNQNYPNPFNPSTTITFALPEATEIQLSIYNMQGQMVKTLIAGQMEAGHHAIVWTADDASGAQVSTGMYIYRIRAGQFVATRRLLLLK